jgi:hypothetical protein
MIISKKTNQNKLKILILINQILKDKKIYSIYKKS